MTSFRLIGLVAMAISSIGFSTAVLAQDEELVSKEVSYSDLDLSTRQGKDQLETRIKAAVREVCFQGNSRTLHDIVLMRQCRFQATKKATREMQVAIANYNGERMAFKQGAIVGN
jgi:UrcA family protein